MSERYCFSFFAFGDARVVEFREGHAGGYFVFVVEDYYVSASLDGIDLKTAKLVCQIIAGKKAFIIGRHQRDTNTLQRSCTRIVNCATNVIAQPERDVNAEMLFGPKGERDSIARCTSTNH